MKKYRLIYIVMAAVLVLSSCKKDVHTVLSDQPTVPVLTAPAAGTTVEMTEANTSDSLALTWSAANYGYQAAVTYTVEFSIPRDSFATPKSILTSTKLAGKISLGAFNNLLAAAEIAPGVVTNIDVRVKAYINDLVPDIYSPVFSLAVKPYRVVVVYPMIYVPGSYQGWAPATAPALYSVLSNNKYEGFVNFPDAGTQFKFTADRTWTTNWGDTGANGTLDPNGDNIVAADAGYYQLKVDIPALTYSMVKTTWGLIGSAGPHGWDSDVPMTYDATSDTWSVTLDLIVGEVKFRANSAWDINFGDNGGNLSLEYGGANIAVPAAGNYTVTLDLRGPIYTYNLKKN